jgi:hypothetical protein
MTVSISQFGSGVVFETVRELPHEPGKFIAGFAKSAEKAKEESMAYVGGPVEFIES